MVLFNSLIKLIFDVSEIIWKMVAGVELGWTVFFFSSQCQSVELTSSGDSLVSDEGCKHYTKHMHTSHSRTRDFFSRGSRLESSSQQESLCLSEKSFSHQAQHVARALVVVSLTLEHYLTFHMHSRPTFYPTFVAVHFTRRFTLRGSIECVFRLPGWTILAYKLWAQGSHWREHLFCQTDVLPQTENDVGSKKRTKLPFSHIPTNGVSQRHPQ